MRIEKKCKFIFTNDLYLIKPHADYYICIENFFSRFWPNGIILYNKTIGFGLIQYKDFCPEKRLNDPYCLDFLYNIENQRGKGHGKKIMKIILNHFQIVIHLLDSPLIFFEHISKDLGLEKINTGLLFGNSFISSNLNVNRLPIVISCLGGCRRKFSGFKRYACPQ